MIKIKSIRNFRDFSALKNKDNLSVKDGLFYRCGHLNKISQKDSLNLQKMGIKYIIDLRSDVELREQPDKKIDGIEHLHIPLLTAMEAGITQDTISTKELLDTAPEMEIVYAKIVREDATNQMKKIMDVILNADGGVIFHCTAGKDRTGVVAFILLYLLDFNMDDIIQNYLLTNEYSKKDERLAKIAIFLTTFKIKYVKIIGRLFTVKESYIKAFTDAIINKYSSIDNFIKKGLDIDDDKKAAFKAKVLE